MRCLKGEENFALCAVVDESQPEDEGEQPAIRAVAEGMVDLVSAEDGDGESAGGSGGPGGVAAGREASRAEAREVFDATRRRQVAFAEAEAAEDQTLVAGVVRGRTEGRRAARGTLGASGGGGGGGDYRSEDYREWESSGGGGFAD
eukprot:SAG11_NODE_6142_length_1379_cov_1.034375_1_plen_146_part_00